MEHSNSRLIPQPPSARQIIAVGHELIAREPIDPSCTKATQAEALLAGSRFLYGPVEGRRLHRDTLAQARDLSANKRDADPTELLARWLASPL